MRRTLLGLFALLGAAGCMSTAVDVLPLTLTVQADRTTVAPQDTVSFVVDAGGAALLTIQAEYGDGITDFFTTSGARTAHVTFKHLYAAKGTYTAIATVFDAAAGQKNATVVVHVN
jgi:hypothetical protein